MRGAFLIVIGILLIAVPIEGVNAHQRPTGSFWLTGAPDKLTLHRGGAASAIIALHSSEGLTGKAQLTLTWDNRIPSNTTYSFQPDRIGSSESSILSFTTQRDSTIGNFHFHVWGSLGTETESVRMALKIKQFHPQHPQADFTINAVPLNLTATPGSSASSMVVVTSLEGFDDSVDLSLNWDNVPTNVSASFQQSTLTPTATSNLTLTTGKNTPTGVYGFHVLGTSDDLIHESPQMFLNISSSPPPTTLAKDFTLEASPDSWTINASETIDYNLTLMPVNGFNQAVSISVFPDTHTGANITLSSSTATPPALVKLEIETNTGLTSGAYSFVVTATNGSLTHKATVYMIVLPATSPPSPAVLLTLTLSRNNITLGDAITASGKMLPTAAHTNIPILLLYTNVSNINWHVLATVTTNGTAFYSYGWTPLQAGIFALRAIWAGDVTHDFAISNIAMLRVNQSSVVVQPAPEFPWFWLAIAAIIIIGVATAVALRIRRKPIATSPTP